MRELKLPRDFGFFSLVEKVYNGKLGDGETDRKLQTA